MQICGALVGESVRARALCGLHRRLGNAGIHAQEELHLGRVIATVGTVADAEKHVSETRLGIVWFRRFPSSIMDRPGSDGPNRENHRPCGRAPRTKSPARAGLKSRRNVGSSEPTGPQFAAKGVGIRTARRLCRQANRRPHGVPLISRRQSASVARR